MFILQALFQDVKEVSVLLKSDTVTTVAYSNHLGGTKSHTLVKTLKELWSWCLSKGHNCAGPGPPWEVE